MIIDGLKFKCVNHHYDEREPTVFVYRHLANDRYYVSYRLHPAKTIRTLGHPAPLKQYLQIAPSDTVLYAHPCPGATVLDLRRIATKLNNYFHSKGQLISRNTNKALDSEDLSPVNRQEQLVCIATDRNTGAKYLFTKPAITKEETLVSGFASLILTHNTHVRKGLRHANRTMHEYTRAKYPLNASDWCIQKRAGVFPDEIAARRALITISRDHINSGCLVLNRICDQDALYYRNEVLKMPTMDMNQYTDIMHCGECQTT